MKHISVLIALILLTVGCVKTDAPNSMAAKKRSTTLRVGISTNYPPIAYKQNNKIVGLEVDFAKGLATFTGKKLKLIQLKWQDQIPSLLSGKIDIIMSGMTITNARKYRIAFTNPYMMSAQISLVKRVHRSRFITGMTDLLSPSVMVGTITGTTGDLFIQDVKANGMRTQFSSSADAVKALLAGKLDAFVYDLPGNLYLASMYTDQGLISVNIPLTKEYLGWGIRPDDGELLASANDYISSLAENSQLLTTIQRWIPFYKP